MNPVERPLPPVWERVVQAAVTISVAAYLVEVDALGLPNSRASAVFLWLERILASGFTVEYAWRLWNAPNRKVYAVSTRGVLDLVAIAPFWIGFMVPEQYLSEIRTLRILRLLKFYRYNPAMQNFMRGIKQARTRLLGLGYVVLVLLLFGAVLMREIEGPVQPERFGTISGSLWYTVCTLTTVGYGDVVPQTALGRVVASVFMIAGVGLVAAFLGIIGGACFAEMEHAIEESAPPAGEEPEQPRREA